MDLSLFKKNLQYSLGDYISELRVVLLDKSRYAESMFSSISDWTKFEEITVPMQKYSLEWKTKINTFLRKLNNLKYFLMTYLSNFLAQILGFYMGVPLNVPLKETIAIC